MWRHAVLQSPKWRSPWSWNPHKSLSFLGKLQNNLTLRLRLPHTQRCAAYVFTDGRYNYKYDRQFAKHLNDGLQRSLRNYSIFSESEENLENLLILESWSNSIDPFGELSIKGSYSVHIEPVNPHEHPEMNIAHVAVYAEKTRTQEVNDNYSILQSDIHVEDMGRKLKIHGKPHSLQPLRCDIQLPIKFGIHVDLSGEGEATCNVSDMESSQVCITTTNGSCTLNNIRAGYVRVHSGGGDIICSKTLQGNVDLHTDLDGVISTDKIQGSSVKIRTDRGTIRTGPLYADYSVVWSSTGSVQLGSCHGNTTVTVYCGDISVDSIDGDLKAKVKLDGNVKAYLDRPGKGEITVGKGDITLQLPDSVQAGICLKGQTVEIDQTFKHVDVNETTDNTCTVYTGSVGQCTDASKVVPSQITATSYKGSVILQCCDWFKAAMSKTENRKP